MLGPGTEKYVSGIFQQAWALGPHARAYLNSSQLPLPYFRRADELQAHTHTRAHGTEFGGYGAKQYHFVFSPDTHDKVSFADLPVTPNALPDNFLSDFLALENWPSAATLLTKPNNTICWPDNASLRMWLPDVDSDRSRYHDLLWHCWWSCSTLGYRDIHQESADRQGAVWNSYFSHVPQYESLASVFYSSMEYWVGYTSDAIPRSTIDPILASYKELCSHYQAGLHAWRLPPHTLTYNLYTHIFSMYALDSLLLEGFGAGAYSAAVAALMAYRPPSRGEYSKFDCVLTCNSSMSTTQLILCNCSLPMTPLPKGTSTMTPASLTLSVSFSMCMIVFRHGVSTKSSSITFTTEEWQCWPCTMALMHNVTMLNYIKPLSNLGRTSVTIVTTIKRLFLPSNTFRPPPFLQAFSSLWRMNNLRLVKAL